MSIHPGDDLDPTRSHVNGLARDLDDDDDDEGEGMSMAEVDRHLVQLIREVSEARGAQTIILNGLDDVKASVRRFDEGIQRFYSEDEGWPRVVKLEAELEDLRDRLAVLEKAHPRQGLRLPSIPQPIRDNAVPAGMATVLLGGLYGLLQLAQWAGAWLTTGG